MINDANDNNTKLNTLNEESKLKPKFTPKPEWLKVTANTGETNRLVMRILMNLNLHTVCEEANCPNCGECFGNKTATFMILGKECTRNCTFCCVSKGTPSKIDPNEPENIAKAVEKLGLKYVVITSVTRDDLKDGGARHFAKVIAAIKEIEQEKNRYIESNKLWDGNLDIRKPSNQSYLTTAIEVLIPDFKGNLDALKIVVDANPDVVNHNIETVPRLYSAVRPQASYTRSLELLSNVKKLSPDKLTKTGIMLGLGENPDEVLEVFADLRTHNCDFITIGQYLSPSSRHHPVIEYITPEKFLWYKQKALDAGFKNVASGPLVRSSYKAKEFFN